MKTSIKTDLVVVGLGLILAVSGLGCGDAGSAPDVPDRYDYPSRFADGESSVAYSGQVFRQVLILDLKSAIGTLTERVDPESPFRPGEILSDLLFYYEFDSDTSGHTEITLGADLPLTQKTFNDISTGKDLVAKMAGRDTATDHKDWSTQFEGWNGASSPDALLRQWFGDLDAAAVARSANDIPVDPAGNQIPEVYVTASGLDHQQLVQKFLLGAVTFSQGHDDYLDDDVAGKGLLSANTQDEDHRYTKLEHAWDEGFGYFGAARLYGDMGDEIVANAGAMDGFGDQADGILDLSTEWCFGASTNAAKRDREAAVAVDFTGDAWLAFRTGRAIIAAAGDELSGEELSALRSARDDALRSWENAIAATVIHYINETVSDMDAFSSDDYDFLDHAKHWSELKGFALGLQFSPHSPLSASDFTMVHALLGISPVLEDADSETISDYRAALLTVRETFAQSYNFDAANVEAW